MNIGKDKVKSCISPHTGFLSFGWCRLILHLFSPSSSPYLLMGGETLETFALSSYLLIYRIIITHFLIFFFIYPHFILVLSQFSIINKQDKNGHFKFYKRLVLDNFNNYFIYLGIFWFCFFNTFNITQK